VYALVYYPNLLVKGDCNDPRLGLSHSLKVEDIRDNYKFFGPSSPLTRLAEILLLIANVSAIVFLHLLTS
jgi:hypothetical protein